jgi:hypothetical protein
VPSCIFDGVSPTTRAHIFREAWIRDPTSSSDVLRHVLTRHEPGDEFEREWLKDRADFKVNCACNGCNSVWMNDLDHAAEDVFVTAAAKGGSVKLTSPSDKLTVARWCVLVATLFDQGQGQPRLDARFHHAFYRGAIPEGVGVWLANVVPDDTAPIAFAFIKDLISEDEDGADLLPPAYFVTFGGRASRRTGDDPVLLSSDEHPRTPSHVRRDPPLWRGSSGDLARSRHSSRLAPAGATGLV